MPIAIALIVIGWTLAYSAVKGLTLTDVFAGKEGDPLDAKGGSKGDFSGPLPSGGGGSFTGGLTAKGIIDSIVIPLANKNGINVSAASVTAANGRHGPTITGGRSDHQGPPETAWAADMSNGNSPTPQMDALARDLAREFGIPWKGSGEASVTKNGWRFQMIYRSMVGGNHFNHVHFGARKA